MNNSGFTIWFTGLSGAGKSTLSEIIEKHLRERGHRIEVLDGDIVRTHLSKGLASAGKTAIPTFSALLLCAPFSRTMM